jgi:hypothetical protein
LFKTIKTVFCVLSISFIFVSVGLERTVQAQQPYFGTTTIAQPFYIEFARVDGGLFNVPNVISGLGATRTLVVNESGSVIDLDRAAGIVVTLPAPAEGLYFDFIASVSVTSNAYKFSTGTQGTDWILGSYFNVDTDTSNAVAAFTCNGTSHDNFSMNGTTTGGLLGSQFRLTAVSTTVWVISGHNEGSGTVATACATS